MLFLRKKNYQLISTVTFCCPKVIGVKFSKEHSSNWQPWSCQTIAYEINWCNSDWWEWNCL